MLEKLSIVIVSRLKMDGVIEESLEDIYVYGMQVMLSNLLGIISSLLIGIIFSSFIEVVVFLVSFIATRRYTGGFHANSTLKCFLITCLSVIAAISIDKFCNIPNCVVLMVGAVSTLVIIMLSPIENRNKVLTDAIRKRCKYVAIALSLSQCVLMLVLKGLQMNIYKMLFASMLFVAISMCLTIHTGRRNKDEEDIVQEDRRALS